MTKQQNALPPLASSLLAKWHALVANPKPELLDELLADNVVFHTPIYHKARKGKMQVAMILEAAIENFGPEFHYINEYFSGPDCLEWVLLFESKINGQVIRGVDIMRWSKDGKLVEMEVALRPVKQTELFGQMQKSKIEAKLRALGMLPAAPAQSKL